MRALDPTADEKVIDPVPVVRSIFCAPSIAWAKEISPAPTPVCKLIGPINVIGPDPLNKMDVFVVVIEPPS